MREYWGISTITGEDIIVIGYNLQEACEKFHVDSKTFKVEGCEYID